MGKLVAVLAVLLVVAFFAVGAFFILSIGESDFTGDFDLSGVTSYEPCLQAPGGCPCLRTRDCPERLEEFQDHPVFWLGEEFDGLPLTRVDFIDSGERGGRRTREVVMNYGACVPSGDGCGIPLSIIISRFCETAVDFAVIKSQLSRSDIRGTEAYTQSAGAVSMWVRTSNVAVLVHGRTDSSSAGQVVENIVRADGAEPDSPGEPFEPPVDDCYFGAPASSRLPTTP